MYLPKSGRMRYSRYYCTSAPSLLYYTGFLIFTCSLFQNYIFQAGAFPQDEEDQSSGSSGGLGGFFKSAAKAVDEHKGAALSAIGLEEGKEGEALTTILKGLNIDSTIITNLTSSFTGQEGFTTLMDAFKNPEKLQPLLADKTGMDNETIQGFVENIKNKFK